MIQNRDDKIIKRFSARNSVLNIHPKQFDKKDQEISEEFYSRQKVYENLNKIHQYDEKNQILNQSAKKSSFHHFKDAVNEAKLKFFESTPQQQNYMKLSVPNYQQYNKSIEVIAEQLRTQKKIQKKQSLIINPQKQWSLKLILIIILPIICLFRVLLSLTLDI